MGQPAWNLTKLHEQYTYVETNVSENFPVLNGLYWI